MKKLASAATIAFGMTIAVLSAGSAQAYTLGTLKCSTTNVTGSSQCAGSYTLGNGENDVTSGNSNDIATQILNNQDIFGTANWTFGNKINVGAANTTIASTINTALSSPLDQVSPLVALTSRASTYRKMMSPSASSPLRASASTTSKPVPSATSAKSPGTPTAPASITEVPPKAFPTFPTTPAWSPPRRRPCVKCLNPQPQPRSQRLASSVYCAGKNSTAHPDSPITSNSIHTTAPSRLMLAGRWFLTLSGGFLL
jgi:hypothetical protein